MTNLLWFGIGLVFGFMSTLIFAAATMPRPVWKALKEWHDES